MVRNQALSSKHQIAKRIAAAEAERLAANTIAATRTLEEDRRIAINDPRRFVTADGNLQPITNWTEEMAAVVASIEVVRRRDLTAIGTVVLVYQVSTNRARRCVGC